MNVLVISTSLRPKSNSDALAREFARGAADAGAQGRGSLASRKEN